MSKKSWLRRQAQAMHESVRPIGPDAPTVDAVASEEAEEEQDEEEQTTEPEGDIRVGQIWEGVVVPNRPINMLGLRVGATLNPLLVVKRFDDGTGHWACTFVGESVTSIRVDEEMLKSGRLRE